MTRGHGHCIVHPLVPRCILSTQPTAAAAAACRRIKVADDAVTAFEVSPNSRLLAFGTVEGARPTLGCAVSGLPGASTRSK
jgi:hypothetical protein